MTVNEVTNVRSLLEDGATFRGILHVNGLGLVVFL
jgi:hypothetical protein